MTQFVAGAQSQTLPMRVYSSVRLGVDPQINVLATIVVAIAAAALVPRPSPSPIFPTRRAAAGTAAAVPRPAP